MKILFNIIFLFSISPYALSSGTMSLEGTIYGKTEKSFMVLSKNEIFTISKLKLADTQRKAIETLRFGAPVSMAVPMEAITQVKIKK